jgi:hypothetical protein
MVQQKSSSSQARCDPHITPSVKMNRPVYSPEIHIWVSLVPAYIISITIQKHLDDRAV